jgi:hypothetical protein
MFSYLKVWIAQLPSHKTAEILGGLGGAATAVGALGAVEALRSHRESSSVVVGGQSASVSASSYQVCC